MWVKPQELENVRTLYQASVKPLRSEDVTSLYEARFQAPPSNMINSAISALERGGYLVKVGKVQSSLSKAKVWEWADAGKTGPVEIEKTKSLPKIEKEALLKKVGDTLAKLDAYFSSLPETQKKESLHYEANQMADIIRSLRETV